MRRWQLQEAKNKLSEVVEEAIKKTALNSLPGGGVRPGSFCFLVKNTGV